MGTPTGATLPLVGGRRVASMRSVVILPAPLGPRKPKISAGRTANSMPVHRLQVALARFERAPHPAGFDDGVGRHLSDPSSELDRAAEESTQPSSLFLERGLLGGPQPFEQPDLQAERSAGNRGPAPGPASPASDHDHVREDVAEYEEAGVDGPLSDAGRLGPGTQPCTHRSWAGGAPAQRRRRRWPCAP